MKSLTLFPLGRLDYFYLGLLYLLNYFIGVFRGDVFLDYFLELYGPVK
jgi:hypothetical protein